MDAVGATASIVGIITAALQSTKIIYQIIEGIKDAPTVIKDLGEKVKIIEDALLRMRNIQLPSQSLKDRMKKCQHDLESFSRKVKTLSDAFNGESRSNKFRKGLKVWFKEEEFRDMNRILNDHQRFFILETSANTMETSEKYGIPNTSSRFTTAATVADTYIDRSMVSIDLLSKDMTAKHDDLVLRLETLHALLKENHAYHPNNGDNGNQSNAQIDGLETSIDRIVSLYNEKETTIFSRAESKKLVKDFEKILDFLQDTETERHETTGSNFKEEDFEDLQRLKGILMSTLSIMKSKDGIKNG
jgi:hypothetical protein